jgi:tetratricopeptide (TPR) repeat protein
VPGLRVIARTSSFSFKGKDADVATIARALSVAHVLEGSVRRSGNKLRISAKLIRTADSGELWSETYDREMSDIFTVQDDISAAVVAQLRLKLLGGAATANPVKPEAYALYLQARTLRYLRTEQAVQQAVVLLKRAVEIEPEFAEAWALLGSSYRYLADGGLLSNAEGYELARRAVSRAFALQPELAIAHAEQASLALGEPDLAAASLHLSRAAASAPEDIAVLRAASTLADYLGRHAEAIAYAQAIVARDPHNPSAHALLGTVYLNAGRIDESIASLREALRQSPGFVTANVALGDALIAKGDPQAALAAIQQESGPWRLMGEAVVYHALKRKAEADAALAELTRAWPKDAAYNIAYIHAYRGNPTSPSSGWRKPRRTRTPAWPRSPRNATSRACTRIRAGCPSCAGSAWRPSSWR